MRITNKLAARLIISAVALALALQLVRPGILRYKAAMDQQDQPCADTNGNWIGPPTIFP